MNNKNFLLVLLLIQFNNLISMNPKNRNILMANPATGEFVEIDVDDPIPGTDGLRPLHRFTILNQPAGLLLCFMIGANINGRDGDDNTPLMVAAMGKKTECIRVLLENRADGSLYNTIGLRAVDFAQAHEDNSALALFKQHKAYDYPNLGWSKDGSHLEIPITPEQWKSLKPENKERLAVAILNCESKEDLNSTFALRRITTELGIIGDNPKKQ